MARDKLTGKQAAFVAEYLRNGFNATRAAMAAGYSGDSAANIGWENVRKREIAAEIKKRLMTEGITPERVSVAVAEIAFGGDLRQFETWLAGGASLEELHEKGTNTALVKSITRSETAHGITRKVELHDRLNALGKLIDVLGLVTQKHEVKDTTEDLSEHPPEEIDRRLGSWRAGLGLNADN